MYVSMGPRRAPVIKFTLQMPETGDARTGPSQEDWTKVSDEIGKSPVSWAVTTVCLTCINRKVK